MTHAVIVSDLHADWHTDGYERLQDVEEALEPPVQAVLKAQQDGKNPVFIAMGDYTNPGSRNVHRAMALVTGTAQRLSVAGVRNYWMVGNHDVIEDGHGSHVLMALAAARLPHVRVIGQPCVVDFGALMLPYVAAARNYNPAEVVSAIHNPSGIRTVFGHLSIPGILYEGSETTHMPRGRQMLFPLEECRKHLPNARLYNGHYHRRQVFEGINIPGSLVRLTHGEEGNANGYLEVEL